IPVSQLAWFRIGCREGCAPGVLHLFRDAIGSGAESRETLLGVLGPSSEGYATEGVVRRVAARRLVECA
ncbi:MAG: hypothetical protein V3T64_13515, partial [Myxococcota bacterium]